jgi:hypothetical protein
MENEKKGTIIGAGASFSTEFDYTSFGFNANFAKKQKTGVANWWPDSRLISTRLVLSTP